MGEPAWPRPVTMLYVLILTKPRLKKCAMVLCQFTNHTLTFFFERNIKAGRLSFTTELEKAVDHATIIFLALPTPPGEDGSADLSYVLGVADTLGKIMKEYKVIVDK